MDTATVLKIIQAIDNRLTHEDLATDYQGPKDYVHGKRAGLTEVRDYLQLSIDADVAAMETSQGM